MLQFASHPALDGARDGFIDALTQAGYKDGDKIKLDLQNAQRDMGVARTIAMKFVSDKKDVIYPIATLASQAVAKETQTIPFIRLRRRPRALPVDECVNGVCANLEPKYHCFGGFRHWRITLRSLGACAPKRFGAQGRRRVFFWRYHGLSPWGSIFNAVTDR